MFSPPGLTHFGGFLLLATLLHRSLHTFPQAGQVRLVWCGDTAISQGKSSIGGRLLTPLVPLEQRATPDWAKPLLEAALPAG